MNDELTPYRELVAQAWCKPKTQQTVMDPDLAEEFAMILRTRLTTVEAERDEWKKRTNDLVSECENYNVELCKVRLEWPTSDGSPMGIAYAKIKNGSREVSNWSMAVR